jgi:hypothetical protein
MSPSTTARIIGQRAAGDHLPRRVTCVGNEAVIDSQFWSALDAGERRGLTRSLAAACHRQNSGYRMTVKDAQSGRTLATFANDQFEAQ